MLLLIDIGNTNTVLSLVDGAIHHGPWRLTTDKRRTGDEYGLAIRQLMQASNVDKPITQAIVASVVPPTTSALTRGLQRYFNITPGIVGKDVIPPMDVRLPQPQEVGADRLVNAYAARETYGNNLIILDFGTATTFDVVDRDGAYAGGIIAPGINLSLDALHKAAAKLPRIDVEQPATVLGKSTVGAMQSGIFYGYLGLIEGLLARLQTEIGAASKVIATGGLAGLFAKACPAIDTVDGDLTIRGLQLLAGKKVTVA